MKKVASGFGVANTGVGVVLQARCGSRRLPRKMRMPFFRAKTIPEILIERIRFCLPSVRIVLATTTSVEDDSLADVGRKCGVCVFRGEVEDVMTRFVSLSEEYELKHIVRVCGDNPFLSGAFLRKLLKVYERSRVDYMSYAYDDGTPVIRSHVGLFAEVFSANALKDASVKSRDIAVREHVTPAFYDSNSQYKVMYLRVPALLQERKYIRLTVDTKEDFAHLKDLYEKEVGGNFGFSIRKLVKSIESSSALIAAMQRQIIENGK